jgi:hypothetical protein
MALLLADLVRDAVVSEQRLALLVVRQRLRRARFYRLADLFILGLGCLAQRLATAGPTTRKVLGSLVALAIVWHALLLVLYLGNWIDHGDYLQWPLPLRSLALPHRIA